MVSEEFEDEIVDAWDSRGPNLFGPVIRPDRVTRAGALQHIANKYDEATGGKLMALNIAGFSRANTLVMPRLIMNVEALEKCGKTHFALTAPGPIAYFDFDTGSEGVMHKFADKKDILVSEHAIPKDGGDGGFNYNREWEGFYKRLADARNHRDIRTVVIDTGTEMWELLRMARFGKLTQVKPHHYGPVNAEVREIIRQFFDSDKNLIMIHKMKPQYVNENWNGKYERSGFKDIGFLVQVNAQMRYEDGEFTCTITDCRQDMGLAGMELSGPMCNFPTLAQMVFPETDLEMWR